MNNKGFTLVELLAVMVILITISLVAVGGITSSLTKREDKEKSEQQEIVKNAAKIYFSLNDDSDKCVSIGTLREEGLISESQKTDKAGGDSVFLGSSGFDIKTGC